MILRRGLFRLTCRSIAKTARKDKGNENKPGSGHEGKDTLLRRVFTTSGVGLPPLPGQARGVLSGVHVSETSGAFSGSLGSARPHTILSIPFRLNAIPVSETLLMRAQSRWNCSSKMLVFGRSPWRGLAAKPHTQYGVARCLNTPPPTTNNLFPSPTHLTRPPPATE